MAENDIVINKLLSIYVCLKQRRYYNFCYYLLVTIPVLQKHSKFAKMNGCNYFYNRKRVTHQMDGCNWTCELLDL